MCHHLNLSIVWYKDIYPATKNAHSASSDVAGIIDIMYSFDAYIYAMPFVGTWRMLASVLTSNHAARFQLFTISL